MTKHINRLIGLSFALALLVGPQSSTAQGFSFEVGPQITTLGVGASATARLTSKIGVSAGYNFFPFSSTEKAAFDNTIVIEPALQGGLLMLTLHPAGGRFALGAGVQFGGASADTIIDLDTSGSATITLGEGEYAADQIDNLLGTFEYGQSVQPSFMIGWIGRGLNFAVGASLATPELTLSATGPIRNDPAFQADLALESEEFADSKAGSTPVYPYVRIGWQFGF